MVIAVIEPQTTMSELEIWEDASYTSTLHMRQAEIGTRTRDIISWPGTQRYANAARRMSKR